MSMKFMHLGDLHLGKNLNQMNLIDDQKYILNELISIVRGQDVDAVLIAGDVYDKKIPSEEAVALFDDFICSLSEMGKAVFVISGNHDSGERLHFGSRLLGGEKVYIVGKFTGTVPCVHLRDSFGEIDVWLLPFVKASSVRYYLGDTEESAIASYDAAVRAAIGTCIIDATKRNVILAHQFVTSGGQDPAVEGGESWGIESVGTIERVDVSCFDAFDYVALGHIHAPQRVGRESARYSGSPLKYSKSEIGREKTVPIVTLGAKGEVQVELVALKPKRDVRHLTGSFDALTRAENIADAQDYVYVTLTDEHPVLDAMARIQQVYPNALHIDYEFTGKGNSSRDEEETVDFKRQSFQEIINSFSTFMRSRALSDEEWDVMREVAKEAGIFDEAE